LRLAPNECWGGGRRIPNCACQSVAPELKSAQKRAFDYLVRQFGMRVEPFPDELQADLNDAFSIWSAMVSSADQPTFAYASSHSARGTQIPAG